MQRLKKEQMKTPRYKVCI